MKKNFSFVSEIDISFEEDLKRLLYFNGQQRKVLNGIKASIEKYGLPIVETFNNKIIVKVEKVSQIQTIFALDESYIKSYLAGVMIFFREQTDCFTLVHLAIDEQYSMRKDPESNLALNLVNRLINIGKIIRDVQYINIFYSTINAKKIRIKK